MGEQSGAVFLSYASEDSEAAQRIADALKGDGIEVWLDKSELRGGDAWDQAIQRQIRDCKLFMPLISSNSDRRVEGYFRLEWRLAVDRMKMMADDAAFLVPVVVDATPDSTARVPESFRAVQWTRAPGGELPPSLVERVARLLGGASLREYLPASTRSPAPMRTRDRPKRPLLAMAAITCAALLVVIGWFAWRHWAPPSASPTVATAQKSVAVLPFVDMSEKRDQEYFSDGLSEELIDLLGKVPGLHVPARTSSFYFKGKQATLPDIAQALNVTHVLEGSVRKSGDSLRITAELVRVDGDDRIWSQTFDRKLDDIFKVQDEIAGAVVIALKASLLNTRAPTAVPTANNEAYTLYLQGKEAMKGGGLDDFQKAIDFFERSVALDPNFAAGWAALADRRADAYATFRNPSYREVTASAHADAARALALDPNLPEAHVALGLIAYLVDLNWDLARRELDRALELAPSDTVALRFLSYLSGTLGRDDEQLQYAQKAIASDPLGYWNHFAAAMAHFSAGRLGDAETELRKALSLNDRAGAVHAELARLLVVRGQPALALEEAGKETSTAWRALTLPIVLDALGRKADADAAVAQAASELGDGYASQIAMIYAARNDRDNAFKWLDRSYLQHDATPLFQMHYPLWKNLRGDPRYAVFLRKMNLSR